MTAIDNKDLSAARHRTLAMAGALTIAIGLGACVQVEAPEKPIVINLNVNIRQEVVYRLDGDARALIEEEGEIF